MSWNDCLYAYAQKHGGDYWGRMRHEWDGSLRMEYRGEPVLLQAVAAGVTKYEPLYSISAALQVTLDRRFDCEIFPKSRVVQGMKTALGQVKKLAPQLPFGEDYGYPELTEQRRIKTSDRPFTKRVLSSLELRQALLDLPGYGVTVAPMAPDSRYHQVQAVVPCGQPGGDALPVSRTDVVLLHELEDYTPSIPEEFEPGLEKLLQLAWAARQAVTAWRMDPPE